MTTIFALLLPLACASGVPVAVVVPVFCSKVWAADSNCPIDALCVPWTDRQQLPNGEHGMCSCEFEDSTLLDHFDLNPQNSTELVLTSCVRSTLTDACIGCYVSIAFFAMLVTGRLAKLLARARAHGILRMDVLGVSAWLLLFGSITFSLTRFNRVLMMSTLLHSSRKLDSIDKTLHVLLSSVLTVFLISSFLFFATTLFRTLSNASNMMGIRSSTRVVRDSRFIGIAGGICIAIGVLMCALTNQMQINSIVTSCGAILIFLLNARIAAPLAANIRNQKAKKHEELRIPALHVMSSLSLRLCMGIIIYLLSSIVFSVSWSVGRSNHNPVLMRCGTGIAAVVQYTCILALNSIFSIALDELLASRIRLGQLQRRSSQKPALEAMSVPSNSMSSRNNHVTSSLAKVWSRFRRGSTTTTTATKDILTFRSRSQSGKTIEALTTSRSHPNSLLTLSLTQRKAAAIVLYASDPMGLGLKGPKLSVSTTTEVENVSTNDDLVPSHPSSYPSSNNSTNLHEEPHPQQ